MGKGQITESDQLLTKCCKKREIVLPSLRIPSAITERKAKRGIISHDSNFSSNTDKACQSKHD
eukprot:6207694-Pleurochrysis_carterae.AAC.8